MIPNFNPGKDFMLFDGLKPIKLYQSLGNPPALNTTTFVVSTNEFEFNIAHALFRQVSTRNVGSVRQIFERGKSVTQDEIALVDTVVEIPVSELKDNLGNLVEMQLHARIVDEAGSKWTVLGYDKATMGSRWRAACRSV